MMDIKNIMIATVLIYAGIIDYRKREIPNVVVVSLLVIGTFFDFYLQFAIIGLVVPVVVFIIANRLTKSDFPGGDFKLLASLGFAIGLVKLSAVILISGLLVVIYTKIKHLSLKRNIPLGSYMAFSFILLQLIFVGVIYM